jgi:hypothetical protein
MRVTLPALILLAAAVLTSKVSGQSTPDAAQLLAQYDAGDYEAFTKESSALPDLGDFRRDLDRSAPRWIRAAGDARARDRRRVVAASVALEVANTNRDRWHEARHLVEWGCALQRTVFSGAPPHPAPAAAYRLWQLASIALIERAFDHVFLVGVPPTLNRDPDPGRGRTRNHLAHAIAALPDEPRLFLAFATAAEFASWGSDSPDPVWIEGERIEQAEPLAPDITTDARTARALTRRQTDRIYVAAAKSDTLWELADIFRGLKPVPFTYARLAGEPPIQAELHVRLGNTYLRLARPHLALPELEKAAAETADPFVVYLAHYFRGRAFEMLDRKSDAEDAYRRALDAMPRAQSASISLAALLFAGGQRNEAVVRTAESLRSVLAPDPWRMYQEGGGRNWSFLIESLRKALR